MNTIPGWFPLAIIDAIEANNNFVVFECQECGESAKVYEGSLHVFWTEYVGVCECEVDSKNIKSDFDPNY